MDLTLSHCQEGKLVILEFNGDVAAANVPQAKQYVQPLRKIEGLRGVIINFENVDFIDPTGVEFFATMVKVFQRQNARLVSYGLNTKNQMLFHIVNLDRALPIYPNLEQARASFEVPPEDQL